MHFCAEGLAGIRWQEKGRLLEKIEIPQTSLSEQPLFFSSSPTKWWITGMAGLHVYHSSLYFGCVFKKKRRRKKQLVWHYETLWQPGWTKSIEQNVFVDRKGKNILKICSASDCGHTLTNEHKWRNGLFLDMGLKSNWCWDGESLAAQTYGRKAGGWWMLKICHFPLN